MTQSAISHQVKSLEDFFGQPLFKRVGRSVQLTDAGRDFLETAGRSLEVLARGTRRLDSYLKPGQVIVTTSPAFASKWLVPRLTALRAEQPSLQPWLYTTDEYEDLEHAELDIAIWRGHGDWPGLKVVKLIDDWITPLCTAALIEARGGEPVPPDLPDYPLLHDERREDWHDWFSLLGVERADISAGMNFSDSGLLIESALAGQGVALGSLVLADLHLQDGSLVRLSPRAIKTEAAYYAVCNEMHLRRPAVQALWDWLVEEGATFDARLSQSEAMQTV